MVLHYPAINRSNDHKQAWFHKLTFPWIPPFLIANQEWGDFLFCRDTAPCELVCTTNFAVKTQQKYTLKNGLLNNTHQSHHYVLWQWPHHDRRSSGCNQISWTRDGPRLHLPANYAVWRQNSKQIITQSGTLQEDYSLPCY